MSSVSSANDLFSKDPYYARPIRNLIDSVGKKDLYYTIPDRIFKLLDQKTNLDQEEKKAYLEIVKQLHQAKKGESRLPWRESKEFKKNQESKIFYETSIVELVKQILGESAINEVMKIKPF